MKPRIVREDCWHRGTVRYTLEVPDAWIESVRWPRLSLVWWVVKLAWGVK